jgi:hypothetical protein
VKRDIPHCPPTRHPALVELTAFRQARGHGNVPAAYVTESGLKLGEWVHGRRRQYRRGRMSEHEATYLNSLGVDLDPIPARWLKGLEHAKAWHKTNGPIGTCPEAYSAPDGYGLGRWLKTQRARRAGRGRLMTHAEIEALDSLGMRW